MVALPVGAAEGGGAGQGGRGAAGREGVGQGAPAVPALLLEPRRAGRAGRGGGRPRELRGSCARPFGALDAYIHTGRWGGAGRGGQRGTGGATGSKGAQLLLMDLRLPACRPFSLSLLRLQCLKASHDEGAACDSKARTETDACNCSRAARVQMHCTSLQHRRRAVRQVRYLKTNAHSAAALAVRPALHPRPGPGPLNPSRKHCPPPLLRSLSSPRPHSHPARPATPRPTHCCCCCCCVCPCRAA